MTAELIYEIPSLLGEGAFWHPQSQRLYWVDIDKRLLHEHDPLLNVNRYWELERKPTVIVQDLAGGLVLGLQGGIAAFNPQTEQLTWLANLEADMPSHRTNDGKCDASGRFWIGTMELKAKPGEGALYCIDRQLNIVCKEKSLGIPNGMGWSPDNKRMYHIDSQQRAVRSFFYDDETASIEFEKNAVEIPTSVGSPDGMAMDIEGMLWVAIWNGFAIHRYNPANGELLETVSLPVPQVSCCAFGGPGMDELFITTAREKMSEADQAKYPLSGSLFKVKTSTKGFAVNRFAGYPAQSTGS